MLSLHRLFSVVDCRIAFPTLQMQVEHPQLTSAFSQLRKLG